jgi:predicted outer membrane repeat protein
MRRVRTIQALLGATTIAAGMALIAPAAQAVTIPVACSENALVAASAHGGANALPVITTPIELIGPAVITRTGLLLYRIAEVAPTGDLTLTTSVSFTNGSVVGNGGGILNHGAVTLTVSSLIGNTATGNGGGLANIGTAPAATFTGSSVTGNTALLLSGGGIYNGAGGTLTATGLPMLIAGNVATVNGGGIAAVNATATTLTGTTVTNNVGVLGGGVYRQGGVMTTTASPISGNLVNNCVGSAPAVPNCVG